MRQLTVSQKFLQGWDALAHLMAGSFGILAALEATGVDSATTAAQTVSNSIGLGDNDPKVVLCALAMSMYALRGAVHAGTNTVDGILRLGCFAPVRVMESNDATPTIRTGLLEGSLEVHPTATPPRTP